MEFDRVTPGLKAEAQRKITRAMCVAPSTWTTKPSQAQRTGRGATKTTPGEAGGPSGGYVLSSPAMIGLMEQTCVRALQGPLPPGFTTVGFHVDVRHLAPAPLGEQVRAVAELVAVDGNRLTFAVEAYYGEAKIGTGTHRRAILPVKAPSS